MYVCMYVCMYVSMYVCIHKHTHTHTHIFTFGQLLVSECLAGSRLLQHGPGYVFDQRPAEAEAGGGGVRRTPLVQQLPGLASLALVQIATQELVPGKLHNVIRYGTVRE